MSRTDETSLTGFSCTAVRLCVLVTESHQSLASSLCRLENRRVFVCGSTYFTRGDALNRHDLRDSIFQSLTCIKIRAVLEFAQRLVLHEKLCGVI